MDLSTEIAVAPIKAKISPLLLIFITVLIDMIGFGIVIPILPLYAQSTGASPAVIGLLLASFSALQLVGAPLLGKWSDRIGRKPVLFLSLLGSALGFLILGMANQLWLLFLGRMLDGLSGGNVSTAQSVIADITPPEKRSKSMGIIGAAFGLGFVLGPALGGFLSQISIQTPFYVAAGIALLNALLIWLFLPETLTPEKRAMVSARKTHFVQATRELLAGSSGPRLLPVFWVTLFSTIGFSGVTALYTLYTEHRFGWDVQHNSYMFVLIGFLGAGIQGGLLGRLVSKCGEKSLVTMGTFALAVGMALMALPLPIWGVWVGSVLLAIGNSFATPVLSGLASRNADPQSQGLVLGLSQSLASLGRMLGPAFCGLLMQWDWLHPENPYGITPFLVASGVMVLSTRLSFKIVSESSKLSPVSMPSSPSGKVA
jgi:MFS transporter, DHA1 family, tetracycline resistance protein